MTCRFLTQSPDPGLSLPTDSCTLTRLQSQPVYPHRPALPCWDTTSPVMSSPCQPGATFIKREVMQLPSNTLDENRSSDDSWAYVSPGNVSTLNYYTTDDRKYNVALSCHTLTHNITLRYNTINFGET